VVTSLADSGPGSYRDALSAGDRYVTFAPALDGGTIDLWSPVHTSASNITIDGSRVAITIRGFATKFSGTNVVVAGLTFRGMTGSTDEDAVTFRSPKTDQIFGLFGNTFETATDGLLDVIWNRGRNVFGTVCGNRFAHHDKAMLVHSGDDALEGGVYHLTLCRNWWYDVYQRAPFTRDSVIHQYNDVFESYGEPDGAGGGSKSGAATRLSHHLLESNVAIPRVVGEVTWDGSITTRPRTEYAGPQWTNGGAIAVRGSLEITRGGIVPNSKQASAELVAAPPYAAPVLAASPVLTDAVRAAAGACRPRTSRVRMIDPCAPVVAVRAGDVLSVAVSGDAVAVEMRFGDDVVAHGERSGRKGWTIQVPASLREHSGWLTVSALGADGVELGSGTVMAVIT